MSEEEMGKNLAKLREKIQTECDCAIEGFMKKQIPTSVVDGTIVQELGWILQDIDKILGIANYEKQIQKQQEKIEVYKNKEKFYNKLSEDNEYYVTELEKKDKIIDLMAEYLSIIQDCPSENCGADIKCENRCSNDDGVVKECWKMYFEKKASEEDVKNM